MRYICLEAFLTSIQKKYPKVKVIVADDTPDDIYETVNRTQFPNVRQYKMPSESGWFAGRGLAISQVETDYFIWMDDDFVVTAQTDLEILFSIIEQTNYDVVSGKVGFSDSVSKFQRKEHFSIDKNENGFCYTRIPYQPTIQMPGYPDCHVTDITSNYFIARTVTAGTIRMDPKFRRKAHKEWFLDGLGFLRVARCDVANVKHAPEECDGRNKAYQKYRGKLGKTYDDSDILNDKLWHYRSYIDCIKN